MTSVNSSITTVFDSKLKSRQEVACRVIESAVGQGRLPNAYLLVGRAAEDKLEIARQVAAFLNCALTEKSFGGSCLVRQSEQPCQNCQWISADKHPQAWLFVTGEGRSQKIPVEKVRALTEELSKTSTFSRVLVILQAEQEIFHRPAANALLKNVEEPANNCLFFFFADSEEDVLATIVSRAQVVPVQRKLHLGYWAPEQSGVLGEGLTPELNAKLQAVQSQLLASAKKALRSTFTTSSYLRNVSDALQLAQELQQLLKQLQEETDSDDLVHCLLDVAVSCEREALLDLLPSDPAVLMYLKKINDAAEEAKHQIDRYVKASTVLESFSYAVCELRYQHSGEMSLAKR